MIKGLTEDQKEKIEDLLCSIIEHYEEEDSYVRETQLRKYKRLKYYWDGFTRIWWDSTAHDWRIWDINNQESDSNQETYDKSVNIFKAYGESIIAALSAVVPPVTCYPDDADNVLDLQTAKAGDKISKLIYRHNNAPLLWLHALFISYTEGMVGCYNYVDTDKKYGTYKVDKKENVTEYKDEYLCTNCQFNMADVVLSERERSEFQPDNNDILSHNLLNQGYLCPQCLQLTDPEFKQTPFIVTRITGTSEEPKSRQCLEAYGGLYLKIPNYAKTQSDCSYLFFSKEIDYSLARFKYPHIREKIQPGQNASNEYYARWARLSTQYTGTEPINVVTERKCWLRPASFYYLEDIKDIELLQKYFPDGAQVCLINDTIADYNNENLDDHWTLTFNPLSDYLTFDPYGSVLTAIQDITNDMVSLILQTIEHGIPQTFVDPAVLNLKQYSQTETLPGSITPATPRTGKSLGDSFYEIKTASLSGESLPFSAQIQEYGQLVSGANPTLFGGDVQGSKTASQFSMMRQQSLQRLGIIWKLFTFWWKEINAKVIPQYIKTVIEQGEERFVEKDENGNFINQFIRYAELQGKIGSVELEANENLPMTWLQTKEVIMQLLQANNPQVVEWMNNPENLPLIYKAIGLDDFYVVGEDDRNKQYEEIKQLLESEPIILPPSEEEMMMAAVDGIEPQPIEEPSVEINPEIDNHVLEFEVCRKFLISPAGLLAKTENPKGYKNVLLHTRMHLMIMQQQMMSQTEEDSGSERTLKSPNKKSDTPIKEDTQNVNA